MSKVINLATRQASAPALENRKVTRPPVARRPKNADVRTREYLTQPEVAALIKAAKGGRWGQRDATLIMVMERHGLRVSEAIALRWDAVDFKAGTIAITRIKRGTPSTHYLKGPEMRALRDLRRDWPASPFLFCSERGGPMTADNVRKLVSKAGRDAKLSFPVHPHMLRHAAGFRLANAEKDTRAIQGFLGHRNITHTVRYTELAPDRFKGF
jgi:type 1 fimbriae regulatory protein FimB/type 1 fimbriae regulatory protein FimE